MIDFRNFREQVVLLALGQAAGDDDCTDAPLFLERQHLANDAKRFLARGLDEAARVDHNDVGAVGIRHQRVAILCQPAEHALGIDEVFGTAEADEGIGSLRSIHRRSGFGCQGKLNDRQREWTPMVRKGMETIPPTRKVILAVFEERRQVRLGMGHWSLVIRHSPAGE